MLQSTRSLHRVDHFADASCCKITSPTLAGWPWLGVHNCTPAHHLNLWSLDLGYGLYVSPVAAGLDCAMVVFLHASLVWEMSYFLVIYCFLCVIMAFACGAWWIVGPGESMIREGGWECS